MPVDKNIIDKDIEKNKTAAVLSYFWILCLLPLLTKQRSKFCQFHAKQGFVLFVLETAGCLIYWFPIFGQLLMLMFFIISIVAVLRTLNGEYWKIPYVYEWSKKIKM